MSVFGPSKMSLMGSFHLVDARTSEGTGVVRGAGASTPVSSPATLTRSWRVCHLRIRLAGDIEENPGPEVLEPCSVCGKRVAEVGSRFGARCASNGVIRDAQASGVNQSSVDWRRGAVPPATTRSHYRPQPGVIGYGQYQIVGFLVWHLFFGDFRVLAEWALRCYPEL